MQTTTFENSKIAFYRNKGEGTPLVFLHGFCEDSTIWDDFVQRLPDQDLLRVDLPGFGQSECISEPSIDRYAEVLHVVLQAMNIKQLVLIGHSMGGYVSLSFAKKFPSLLQGLCLFHSHPYADSEEKVEKRKKSIEFIRQNGLIYYVKQLIPALFTKQYRSSHHLELAKLVYKASHYTEQGIIDGLTCMMHRSDQTSVIEDLAIPFLFLIGKEDEIVPDYLEDAAKASIASIQLLPGVAHMGMLEAPKKCERIVKDFLELVDQCSPSHV